LSVAAAELEFLLMKRAV